MRGFIEIKGKTALRGRCWFDPNLLNLLSYLGFGEHRHLLSQMVKTLLRCLQVTGLVGALFANRKRLALYCELSITDIRVFIRYCGCKKVLLYAAAYQH